MKKITAFFFIISLLANGVFINHAYADSINFDTLTNDKGVYYQNGTLFTGTVTGNHIGMLKNGKKEGIWQSYFDDGRLASKGEFKNGERDGEWEFYKDDCNKKETAYFKNGNLT